MPRDLPDWGALSSQATVHEVTDLGELAARMGSIVTFDRRGDIVWMDDFECGLMKWIATAVGTGAAVAESTAYARNGATSVKLTGGSDSAGQAGIAHYNPIPVLGRVGVEISAYRATTINNLRISHSIADGAALLKPAIRWVQSGTTLQYRDSDGNWQTFSSAFSFTTRATEFHTFKLVTDIENRVYVRAIIDDTEYSLADIAIQAMVGAGSPEQLLAVDLYSRSSENDVGYVDDAIFTQNEPK